MIGQHGAEFLHPFGLLRIGESAIGHDDFMG